jgi:hypothetical protein
MNTARMGKRRGRIILSLVCVACLLFGAAAPARAQVTGMEELAGEWQGSLGVVEFDLGQPPPSPAIGEESSCDPQIYQTAQSALLKLKFIPNPVTITIRADSPSSGMMHVAGPGTTETEQGITLPVTLAGDALRVDSYTFQGTTISLEGTVNQSGAALSLDCRARVQEAGSSRYAVLVLQGSKGGVESATPYLPGARSLAELVQDFREGRLTLDALIGQFTARQTLLVEAAAPGVQLQRPGETGWLAVKQGDWLQSKDQLRFLTDPPGSAVRLLDANRELTLRGLQGEGAPTLEIANPGSWALKEGALYLEATLSGGSLEFQMSQGLVRVTGTSLILKEYPQQSILEMVEGKAEMTALADGSSTQVQKGEAIAATAAGLSASQPFEMQSEMAKILRSDLPSLRQPFLAGLLGSGIVFLGVELKWWIIGGAALVVLLLAIIVAVLIARSGRHHPRTSTVSTPPPYAVVGAHCPACGFANPPGQRFCGGCGVDSLMTAAPPLMPPIVPAGNACPACSRPAMPGDRFCQNCGSAIPGGPA